MPQYFYYYVSDGVSLDKKGVELADASAARDLAIRNARELACEQVLKGSLNLGHRVVVEDEHGTAVVTVRFEDAITVER